MCIPDVGTTKSFLNQVSVTALGLRSEIWSSEDLAALWSTPGTQGLSPLLTAVCPAASILCLLSAPLCFLLPFFFLPWLHKNHSAASPLLLFSQPGLPTVHRSLSSFLYQLALTAESRPGETTMGRPNAVTDQGRVQ